MFNYVSIKILIKESKYNKVIALGMYTMVALGEGGYGTSNYSAYICRNSTFLTINRQYSDSNYRIKGMFNNV